MLDSNRVRKIYVVLENYYTIDFSILYVIRVWSLNSECDRSCSNHTISELLSLGNSLVAFIVRRIVILPTTKERKFQRVALSFAWNYIDKFLARISLGVSGEGKEEGDGKPRTLSWWNNEILLRIKQWRFSYPFSLSLSLVIASY